MNEKGKSAFPATRTLADETGLSRRTVEKHLRQAADQGWIERDIHGFSDQGWKRHEYRPALPDDLREKYGDRLGEGGESNSPPSLESFKGGESDDVKVGNLFPTSTSYNSSNKTNGGSGGESEDEGAVRGVWEHYLTRYADRYSEHRAERLKLDTCGREGHIRARLEEGYSPEELCRAIDGNFSDDWYRDRDKHELEFIVRNQSRVEEFLSKAGRSEQTSARGGGFPEGDNLVPDLECSDD